VGWLSVAAGTSGRYRLHLARSLSVAGGALAVGCSWRIRLLSVAGGTLAIGCIVLGRGFSFSVCFCCRIDGFAATAAPNAAKTRGGRRLNRQLP